MMATTMTRTADSHVNITQQQTLAELFNQAPSGMLAELWGLNHKQIGQLGSDISRLALCRASQPFEVIVDSQDHWKKLVITERHFTSPNLTAVVEWLSRVIDIYPVDVYICAPFNANRHLVNMFYYAVIPLLPRLGCLHLQGPSECLSTLLGNPYASLQSMERLSLDLQAQPRFITPPTAPRLERLKLVIHASLTTLDPRLLCLPWTQLRNLDTEMTGGAFYDVWDVICACESLIELSVTATNNPSGPDPLFKLDPHKTISVRLQSLKLVTNSRSAVVSDFLNAVTLPELCYLNITFDGHNLAESDLWPHRAIVDMWRWSSTPLAELVLFGKIVSEDILSDLVQEFRTLIKVSANDNSTNYVTQKVRDILNERLLGLLQ